MAKRFWICSNLQIREWYPDAGEETIAALERRIKVIQFCLWWWINIDLSSAKLWMEALSWVPFFNVCTNNVLMLVFET